MHDEEKEKYNECNSKSEYALPRKGGNLRTTEAENP
jgi:hypothetical protein